MSVAIRIARAKTKRDKVFFSGYHGWTDWYLAANIANSENLNQQLMAGLSLQVPSFLKGTSNPFLPDSVDALREIIGNSRDEIAAIVIEPARGEAASNKYLSDLKAYAKEIGAVLIFDEITSGFRACAGGIHRNIGVQPDLAVFAKSMANGYPFAMIIGTKEVMLSAEGSFISSTNWTDKVGPAAALATIEKYQKENVASHITKIGEKVQSMWAETAIRYELDISVSGIPTLAALPLIQIIQ